MRKKYSRKLIMLYLHIQNIEGAINEVHLESNVNYRYSAWCVVLNTLRAKFRFRNQNHPRNFVRP